MVLGLKITGTYHQAKSQYAVNVVPISQTICTPGFFNTLNPDLLADRPGIQGLIIV